MNQSNGDQLPAIAYHLLCHGNFPQVAMLIEALYSPEDTFLVDIDDGRNPDTRALSPWLECHNVHVVRDANIGWGGAGTLRKTIRGAFQLLELDPSWQYYIVLSGQDLPLKSNRHIKMVLAEHAATGLNYIRAFRAEPVNLSDIPIDNTTSECVLWGDRGHTRVYAKPGTINPQRAMYARRLVDVSEIGEKGEVYVGLADPLLQRRRDQFFERHPFHVGANWFNLHRSLLAHMVTDPFTYELYDVMRTTFIPDESYFQTYIKNSVFADRTTQNYGRLILRPGPVPRVKVLDQNDWGELQSSDALFARKFDTAHDLRVIQRLLESRQT